MTNATTTISLPQFTRGCIAAQNGDDIIFRGPNGEQHSLFASVTSDERFQAHWAGFVEANGLPIGESIRPRGEVDSIIETERRRMRSQIRCEGFGAFGISFAGSVVCMIDEDRFGDPIDVGRRPTRAEIREMIADIRRDTPDFSLLQLVWVEDVRVRDYIDGDFEPYGESIAVDLATIVAR